MNDLLAKAKAARPPIKAASRLLAYLPLLPVLQQLIFNGYDHQNAVRWLADQKALPNNGKNFGSHAATLRRLNKRTTGK